MVGRLRVGVEQLNRTSQLIEDGQRELAFVPTDRPRVGLVVTMEEFYMGTPMLMQHGDSDLAVRTMSARELEVLVTVDDAQQIIADVLFGENRAHTSVDLAVEDRITGRNPILEKVFDVIPGLAAPQPAN